MLCTCHASRRDAATVHILWHTHGDDTCSVLRNAHGKGTKHILRRPTSLLLKGMRNGDAIWSPPWSCTLDNSAPAPAATLVTLTSR